MTGRTCPVHGEYSATGACRWCEPEMPREESASLNASVGGEPPGASALRDSKTLLDLAREWEAKHPILPWVEFLTQTNPFANEEPRVWNFYGFDTDGTIIHDWWEEIRLNEQHAALRWERVARRWGSKRPTMLDLAKGWGRFVVEAMREHVEKLARTNPLLQDKPKEPTP